MSINEEEILSQAAAIVERRKRERDPASETQRKVRRTKIAEIDASISALSAKLDEQRAEVLALRRIDNDIAARLALSDADQRKLLEWFDAYRRHWECSDVSNYIQTFSDYTHDYEEVDYFEVRVHTRSEGVDFLKKLATIDDFRSVTLWRKVNDYDDDDDDDDSEDSEDEESDDDRVVVEPKPDIHIRDLMQKAGVTLELRHKCYRYAHGEGVTEQFDRELYGAPLLVDQTKNE